MMNHLRNQKLIISEIVNKGRSFRLFKAIIQRGAEPCAFIGKGRGFQSDVRRKLRGGTKIIMSCTKEDVIYNKKSAIKSLNNLLESYINKPETYLKKANLISYWIKDYVRYLKFEEEFKPEKNIAYRRGNVVKINFGFNIGSEYGGLHYAVVIDNKNTHHSPVLTVIPLTSNKGTDKALHSNNVDLGNEIYKLLKIKHDTIESHLKEEKDSIEKILKIKELLHDCLNEPIDESAEIAIPFEEANKILDQLTIRLDENKAEREKLEKIKKEIFGMKQGSIALVNHITTVSKMRIYDPRNSAGVLSGISLSGDSMEKINEKIKELYIF